MTGRKGVPVEGGSMIVRVVVVRVVVTVSDLIASDPGRVRVDVHPWT